MVANAAEVTLGLRSGPNLDFGLLDIRLSRVEFDPPLSSLRGRYGCSAYNRFVPESYPVVYDSNRLSPENIRAKRNSAAARWSEPFRAEMDQNGSSHILDVVHYGGLMVR